MEPNKLSPKYVLDFGEKGIQSTMEGIDSKMSLANKYYPSEFVETESYVFIVYTMNVPNPGNARKGTVFYNACVFDKETGELFHLYIDKLPFLPKGKNWPKNPLGYLANNYDNGPTFWPKGVTSGGNPFMWFKGLDLKENFNTESWKNDAFSLRNMKDDDYLIMIAQ